MTAAVAPPRDDRTLAYGLDLFARLDRRGPTVFTPAWLDDQLMQFSMGDPALKLQLFRFIDALPNLSSPGEVVRHLHEYLGEANTSLPGWLRFAVERLPRSGAGADLLAWAADVNAKRMARRFIAGSNVPEAVRAVGKMRAKNLAFTIDLLGEATITEEEAVAYQKQYFDLIAGLSDEVNGWPAVDQIDRDPFGLVPRVNVSVKLSSLYSQFDPIAPAATGRAVKDRLRPILHMARDRGAFVNFDMEQYAFKNCTLQVFQEILTEPAFRDWGDVGIAIQAYLTDTEADLHTLLAWVHERGTPVWVRLVKGAYWDYETIMAGQNGWPCPVWRHKPETDACYERCTRFLLEHFRELRPAFASHNVRSIAYALSTAEELGVPIRAYEFQALYGMADPIKEALVGLGHRVRIYTPYGQLLPGMAYLVRRLLENTSNESFLRASFTDHRPEEQLLMNPATIAPPVNGRAKHAEKGLPPFVNEPLADFSRPDVRAKMEAALKTVKGQLGQTYPLVIGGKKVPTTQTFDSVNPSRTREVIGRCARATPEQATQAIDAAAGAFEAWRDTEPETRAKLLLRAAQIVRDRHFEFAAWAVLESAKPWREAEVEVGECIDFLEYYAREGLRMATPGKNPVPGEENEYVYDPRGVCVVIAPWNFPLAILCGMVSAAVVTGCPVVMKPAEQSSVIGAKLMEVFEQAGAPPGVVNLITGMGEEVGPTLVDDPRVGVIAFTGSRAVGLAINQQASRTPKGQGHVKRVIAEMGGKNAIIVDSDADLDEAVKGVIEGAFGYAGQKCSACSRAIVLEAKYDQFLHRLIEAAKSLTILPADDPACGVGPVIDEEARDRVRQFVEKGRQECKVAFAGDVGALAGEGSFVAPHIFADVDPAATIAREEIFGPVLAVIKARDIDHALQIANGTEYALTGAVFSRSPQTLALAKRKFRVGNLYLNRKCTGAMVGRQPFGGFKLSGIGTKAGGPDYLLQFVVPRTITENTLRHGFAPEMTGGDM